MLEEMTLCEDVFHTPIGGDAPERGVSMRVAEHAGRIYLDLADEHWRTVSIGADGWRVLGCPPGAIRSISRHVATADAGARVLSKGLRWTAPLS